MPWATACLSPLQHQRYIICRISSSISFDNQMRPYDIKRILTPELKLNREAYHAYSPLLLSWVNNKSPEPADHEHASAPHSQWHMGEQSDIQLYPTFHLASSRSFASIPGMCAYAQSLLILADYWFSYPGARILIFPQANLDSGATLYLRAARHSRPINFEIPSRSVLKQQNPLLSLIVPSSRMVVPHPLCYHVCFRYYKYRSLAHVRVFSLLQNICSV